MIKKIIAGILILAIIVLAGFKLFYKGNSPEKELSKISENLTSYHTEGTMKIYANDEKRVFFVTVDYLKNDIDNFRISLLDENINQEQIMLRNKNGVYVLTPLLNQAYSFKGNYPLNETKPYLYHSIIEGLKGDYKVEKINDGYLITFKPNFPNSPSWIKEEVKLSNDLKPIWVNIYDSSNTLTCEVIFSKVDFNTTYSSDYFDVATNMKTSQENIKSSSTLAKEDDLPLLPVSLNLSSELKDQTSGKVNDEKVYILTYSGNKSFTIVQKIIKPNNDMVIKEVDGELVDLTMGLGIRDNKYLSYVYNGVNYQIYSDSLSVSEMIEVANSMELVYEK